MQKSYIPLFATALAATMVALPAHAQERAEAEQIVVQPTGAEKAYAKRVSRQLDRHLARYNFPLRDERSGFVRVRFIANGEGVAEEMTLVGDSGDRHLDRAAMWAVRRLSDISPAELGVTSGQTVQANIVFANTEGEAERLTERMHQAEAHRIARSGNAETHILALILAPAPRS